jgi:hypothetical protein
MRDIMEEQQDQFLIILVLEAALVELEELEPLVVLPIQQLVQVVLEY